MAMTDSISSRPTCVEVNFDGLVGPTHNYAGLSPGNLASARHADTVSHPKLAALQGLEKIKLLASLGIPQAVLPPHPRPRLDVLRQLGFAGSDADMIARAHRESPRLLAAVYSSSAMWAANAAAVSPAADCDDGLLHVTPANLLTQFHRSLETQSTSALLKKTFEAMHHDALPAADGFADEGAANHLRLCGEYGDLGLEVFVYGRDETTGPTKYPARQTRQACMAVARLHGLSDVATLFVRQSPEAIDAGAFHNDVVLASNQNVLLVHRQAFADATAIKRIEEKFRQIAGRDLWIFVAEPGEMPLAAAISTYIFNSQIVTLPDGTMMLVAPIECRNDESVQRYIERILSSECPIKSVRYVDLRQSMRNGGGPACLRLRVVMSEAQAEKVKVDSGVIEQLEALIHQRYRDELTAGDLADPDLIEESLQTISQIQQLLSASR